FAVVGPGTRPMAPSAGTRPRLQRPRPQPAGKAGGEHAHAHAFDDLPDAIELLFVGHGGATRGTILQFRVRVSLFRKGQGKETVLRLAMLTLPLDKRAHSVG